MAPPVRPVVLTSTLHASPERVREHAFSMAGVNRELAPFLRMTYPKGLERLDAQPIPLGERLFRSWILVLGVLPVEYDDLAFEAVNLPRGFAERSEMLTMRVWRHARTVDPEPGGAGCRLTDRVSFEPRIPGTAGLARGLVRRLFGHRHRVLVGLFGGATAEG